MNRMELSDLILSNGKYWYSIFTKLPTKSQWRLFSEGWDCDGEGCVCV